MLNIRRMIRSGLVRTALAGIATVLTASPGFSADLKGGTLRVAILQDVANFDPLQFSSVNYPLIKNLYDTLIDYTPDGKAIPGLVESWKIAPDNLSVSLKLRSDVAFQSGAPLTADAVAATLEEGRRPGARQERVSDHVDREELGGGRSARHHPQLQQPGAGPPDHRPAAMRSR